MNPGNRKRSMRLEQRQKPKLRLKQIALASSLFSFLLISGLFFYFNFSNQKTAFAAAVGDYRSFASGNWNAPGTWETFNGLGWVPALATPTSANGVITIQSGHTVTATATVTVDQVTVAAGGILTLSGGTFTVANGIGSDIDISGTTNLKTGGTLKINASAVVTILNGGTYNYNGGSQTATGWVVRNGGTYVHNVDGIVIPTASWGASSTLKITGVISSNVTGTYQDFGNVIYDCPNQTCCAGGGGSTLEFTDDLKSIAGNFTVLNTGTGGTWLQKNSSAVPVTISGNYLQSGGKVFMAKGAVFSWNLMGNFTLTGGTFVQAERYSMPVLNVYGTFLITGGTFDHSWYSSNLPNEGIGTVNLYGNYVRTGGLHTESATMTGHGEFNFTKTGTQTFSHIGGTITNTVNFTVVNGSVLDLANYMITGGGTFALQSGGGLILGSANGITSSGASGNIQVTGTRSFSTGGDYTYAGIVAQVTGNGLPVTAHNLTFNNANNVTMTNSSSATNVVTLVSGKIITNSNELGTTNTSASSVTGYSAASYVVGNLRRSVSATDTYDYPVGVMSNYELANVKLTGMTGFTDILGFFTNANPIEPAYPLIDIYVGITPITDMLNFGYWTFTPNSPMAGGTYTITVNEQGHTNPAWNPNEYCVLKRAAPGWSWQSVGTHDNSTQSETGGVATAVRSDLAYFSNFGIGKGGGGGPLPVKLLSFKALQKNNTIKLTWTTAAEINNDYFTLERSANAADFSEITKITGSGTTSSEHAYSYIDENPLSSKSYYRLTQTDFNGKSETFKPVSVTLQNKAIAEADLRVSPNPFNDSFIAEFKASAGIEIEVTIINMSGVVVYSEKATAVEGINKYRFVADDDFKEGTYILRLSNGKTLISSKKIICKKI